MPKCASPQKENNCQCPPPDADASARPCIGAVFQNYAFPDHKAFRSGGRFHHAPTTCIAGMLSTEASRSRTNNPYKIGGSAFRRSFQLIDPVLSCFRKRNMNRQNCRHKRRQFPWSFRENDALCPEDIPRPRSSTFSSIQLSGVPLHRVRRPDSLWR